MEIFKKKNKELSNISNKEIDTEVFEFSEKNFIYTENKQPINDIYQEEFVYKEFIKMYFESKNLK